MLPPLLADSALLSLWWVAWTAWFFAFGACVGSFLNVVIYRLPAGENIAYPRSRCGRCGTTIRWFDNVPVLSWLLLGGQCRDCGGPIGIRYPLVELTTAVLFVLVLWFEWFSSAANLPTRYVGVVSPLGESWYRANPDGLLEATLAFHLVLLVTLLAATLIEYDGHPQPVSLYLPAWLMGLCLPLVFPLVRPMPWDARLYGFLFDRPWWERNTPVASFCDAFPAVGAAIVLPLVVLLGLLSGSERVVRWLPSWMPLVTVLLFLGWQATLVATLGAVLLFPVLWLARTGITWNLALFLTTTATILTWNRWDGYLWPRTGGGPTLLGW